MPEVRTVWRTRVASNQPQRRLRPVTTPNSLPFWPMSSPISSKSSVGKGPSPTRRSEEHTSELQSRQYLVCRLLLEKKKKSTLRLTICNTEDQLQFLTLSYIIHTQLFTHILLSVKYPNHHIRSMYDSYVIIE